MMEIFRGRLREWTRGLSYPETPQGEMSANWADTQVYHYDPDVSRDVT